MPLQVATAGDPDGPPRVVLVVATDAGALEQALRQRGLRATGAGPGDEARAALASGTVSAVLVDLPEPERAAAACAELAGLDAGGHLPLLVAVDPEDGAAMDAAFSAGATDLVARPLQLALLARRLDHLARSHAAELFARWPSGATCSLDRDTGLADRQELANQIARACEQARTEGSTVALLHVEVERYRELIHGLPIGSAASLLAGITGRLRRTTRASDTVAVPPPSRATIARVGSGEFCLLLQGLVRSEDAAKAARRIQDSMSDPIAVAGRPISVRASIGICCFPGEGCAPEELVDCARVATENARHEGRGAIRFYDASMDVKAFERLSLENGMRQGIERGEFVVHYQPRIEISSGRIVGFEALVRWQHPELGLIAPGQFIPLAEETGLIVPIGEHVLRTACQQAREWQRRGLDPVAISVNLSSVQFQRPELYETVVRVLGETGLDPTWLELELTESLLMQNVESVVSTLKRFRDTGIRLSIDDFGTGYSSLSYLKRFPIDALKIDRSFIREVTTNADDAALATSIILMGRSLKLKVVAEGVETASQLSFLRIMQCDEAQGFLYSPPVPAEDAELLLRKGAGHAAA